uniref:Hypothetical conserved protein n=1 Tax=Acetithermum autotrophicum TaxID=1446466 RepID=H5SSR6_ACEAU|nr:hypothetical conserved protein [Candidatus Acetothermum autotrophicum]
MAKRRTIGTNPLDVVIPTRREAKSPTRVVKERLTVHLPVDLIDRIKNAVYWTPGLTLARLAEEALTAAVARLERERGEPFPPRRSELTGGRPLK